jgi:hypothetical protein
MWLTLRAMALVLVVSVCAYPQTRTLALYAGAAQGLDSDSKTFMETEVDRLMAPAGLTVVWKSTTAPRSGENFELLAVASFDGSCATSANVPAPANVSLADTSVSEGHVLPFFHVDCSRLSQMLGPHAGSAMIGRALGRVIAHELYHIIAQTKDHHDTGVAKAAFSFKDLTNPRFEFDAWSLDRMRPANVARDGAESEISATGR